MCWQSYGILLHIQLKLFEYNADGENAQLEQNYRYRHKSTIYNIITTSITCNFKKNCVNGSILIRYDATIIADE